MESYVAMPGQLIIDPVSNQMSLGTTVRQKGGKSVIAVIHSPGFYEITGNEQIRLRY